MSDQTNPQLKQCSKCEEILNLDLFYKKSKSKDGLQSHCKDCHDVSVSLNKQDERDRINAKIAHKTSLVATTNLKHSKSDVKEISILHDLYSSPEECDLYLASLLNSAATQKRAAFKLSRSALREMVKGDTNLPKKLRSFENRFYSVLLSHLHNSCDLKLTQKGVEKKCSIFQVTNSEILSYLDKHNVNTTAQIDFLIPTKVAPAVSAVPVSTVPATPAANVPATPAPTQPKAPSKYEIEFKRNKEEKRLEKIKKENEKPKPLFPDTCQRGVIMEIVSGFWGKENPTCSYSTPLSKRWSLPDDSKSQGQLFKAALNLSKLDPKEFGDESKVLESMREAFASESKTFNLILPEKHDELTSQIFELIKAPCWKMSVLKKHPAIRELDFEFIKGKSDLYKNELVNSWGYTEVEATETITAELKAIDVSVFNRPKPSNESRTPRLSIIIDVLARQDESYFGWSDVSKDVFWTDSPCDPNKSETGIRTPSDWKEILGSVALSDLSLDQITYAITALEKYWCPLDVEWKEILKEVDQERQEMSAHSRQTRSFGAFTSPHPGTRQCL